ncbi:cell division protein FtsX [Nitrosospira sp. Nsp5]|jgi:cell division transport system permease protein|uniref:Cell division protein FtsX n=1 Tax=Nitrosospira multiformis TaxID=1231 RepID=A0ABY0T6Z5_9PROT|nr:MULTISPECIES: permease-like cell division protein FtsX [Nitrosospira]PTR06603.1 cell division protein FtsX [Nitrosospira sp. Nsp5]SDQ36579.1 cell division protein FtsX [Nitrosospira multiformis]
MSVWLAHHWYAFVLALKRLAGAPIGNLLSIIVIGIAFSLPAGIYMLLGNLQAFSTQVSGAPQLSLFLELDTNGDEVAQIAARLKEHPQVASFEFIPRDSALEQLKQSNGLADLVDSLERNPLPDAFVINARSLSPAALEELHAELQKWPRIEHVQLDSAWAKRLDALINLGRLAVLMLAALLSFALVAVTFNTIRLQILTKRDEIEVSKLIGATNGFIRRPFLYFGAIQGMAGGMAAWLIISLGIHLIDDELRNLTRLYVVDFPLYHLSPEDSLTLLLLSACLGWLGAWLSVANHLWQIEPS